MTRRRIKELTKETEDQKVHRAYINAMASQHGGDLLDGYEFQEAKSIILADTLLNVKISKLALLFRARNFYEKIRGIS